MKTKHFFLSIIFVSLILLNGFGQSSFVSNTVEENSKPVSASMNMESENSVNQDTVLLNSPEPVLAEGREALVKQQFDLSTISVPENEVDDLGIDTREIFLMIMKEKFFLK